MSYDELLFTRTLRDAYHEGVGPSACNPGHNLKGLGYGVRYSVSVIVRVCHIRKATSSRISNNEKLGAARVVTCSSVL